MDKDFLHRVSIAFNNIRHRADKRLSEFKNTWEKGTDKQLFKELVFCLLTPQAKAINCWRTVRELEKDNLLFQGNQKQLALKLNYVRFRNNKAKYIIHARNSLKRGSKIILREKLAGLADVTQKRLWLIENIKGMGYKEASHFLRNIGFGKNLAILDRHIVKNLVRLGVIAEIPSSLSPKKYLRIEKKMLAFSEKLGIAADYMDMILWYMETGAVFK